MVSKALSWSSLFSRKLPVDHFAAGRQIPPLPLNEQARLQALGSYPLPEAGSDAGFNQLVELAALLTDKPVALITAIEQDRLWFMAKAGTRLNETARDTAFCSHTIMGTSLLVIEDLRSDKRFSRHPLVTGEPYLRFYAGMPLISEEGYALGSLCVLDYKPGTLTRVQQLGFEVHARQVMHQLELRRKAVQYGKAKEALGRFAQWQSHQVRSELSSILGLLQLVDHSELSGENKEYFTLLLDTARKMDQQLTASVYHSSNV